MAIIWTTQTSDVNTALYRADVTFTRTDDTLVDAPFTITYSDAIIETSQQRQALFDQAWGQWQVEKAQRESIKIFLGTMGQEATAYLATKEIL